MVLNVPRWTAARSRRRISWLSGGSPVYATARRITPGYRSMNNPCPQVTSLAALLSLLQLRQSCRWPVAQGVELHALCGERGREVMLNLQTAFQPPGFYQQLLTRRGQLLDVWNGCYLCLNRDRVLSCWRQLPGSAVNDKQHIAQLFSLAGMRLAD